MELTKHITHKQSYAYPYLCDTYTYKEYCIALKKAEKFLSNNKYGEEKCSVQDVYGNNCPEKVATYIDRDGVKLPLCRKCYNNVMMGSYGC